ncbi:hypothetical protein BKH46_02945 [Helicobacter sp. 12S02634-8]|nr:hypothetical protein BKH46_02945 [Helicobacter sp. 12S02634-8]
MVALIFLLTFLLTLFYSWLQKAKNLTIRLFASTIITEYLAFVCPSSLVFPSSLYQDVCKMTDRYLLIYFYVLYLASL